MSLELYFGAGSCALAQSGTPISPDYILTPTAGPAPRINGAQVFGVRPGHPIVFTIPVSGQRPLKMTALDLPKAIKLDAATGRLSGILSKKGEYKFTLDVVSEFGTVNRVIKIIVGKTLASTPPMVWNNWNIYADDRWD